MKRGGDAGGPVRKTPIEAIKHVPKFLEQMKLQYVKKEASLNDKFADHRFTNDFIDKAEDQYDLENAQVVREDDDDNIDDMPAIMPEHRKLSGENSKGQKEKNSEKKKKEDIKVDLNEFKPTFKSKKPHEENNKSGANQKGKEDKTAKEYPTKNKSPPKLTKEGSKHEEDSINQKRGLGTYIKDYIKDEKEEEKKKKIKTSLLSFGDDE